MPLFFVCFVLCSDKLVCVFVYMGKNLFMVVFYPLVGLNSPLWLVTKSNFAKKRTQLFKLLTYKDNAKNGKEQVAFGIFCPCFILSIGTVGSRRISMDGQDKIIQGKGRTAV